MDGIGLPEVRRNSHCGGLTYDTVRSSTCSYLTLLAMGMMFFSYAARGVLLVLDDVWDAGVIRAFRAVGLSLLVTTRKVRGLGNRSGFGARSVTSLQSTLYGTAVI